MAAACIRTQLHLAHPCKRCTPALKGFVCAAVLRCSYHGNSQHPQPVALVARQQPAFARSYISAHPCKSCTPALKGFVTAAVLRSLGHGNSLQPQPVALAAASLRSQPAAFRSAHSAALRPEGLHLRSHAFAISITATVSIRSQLLSWHGNSLHPQPVACMAAACIRIQLHFAQHESAALRLEGLRLRSHAFASTATACSRSRLLSWHGSSLHSHAAVFRSSLHALHTSPDGLRLHCIASLFVGRQQPAVAVGCSHGTATACIRSRLLAWQQACIRTQLHLALAAVRCPQLVQPPSATYRCSPQAPKSLHPLDTAAAKKKSCSNAETCSGKEAPEDYSSINALGGRTTRCIFICLASLAGVSELALGVAYLDLWRKLGWYGECIMLE